MGNLVSISWLKEILMVSDIASRILLVLPWPLLCLGLAGVLFDSRFPVSIRRLASFSAIFSLICALLAIGASLLGSDHPLTVFSIPIAPDWGHFSITVVPNPLSLVMAFLVSFVGVIVTRYAKVYMDGDPGEGRFHRQLSLTLGSFFTLVVVDNIWAFFLSWVATSLFLNTLLSFYKNRPGSWLSSRKNFVLSRLSDFTLLSAFYLTSETLHVDRFSRLPEVLGAWHGPLSGSLSLAAFLIAVSAILKSAQFPLHGWLISVMEAPTPVSALLHAGIIYTGAFLVLRTSPMLSLVSTSMNLLAFFGIMTIVTTSFMMITESNIKESLAYSTCAQMGFMLMECGLGLYTVAVLHIVSHSLYKAHAFLSSGSVVDHFRAPVLPPVRKRTTLGRALTALFIGFLLTVVIALLFGETFGHRPELLVMGSVLSVSGALLILQGIHGRRELVAVSFAKILFICAFLDVMFFSLHSLSAKLFGDSLPEHVHPTGLLSDGVMVLIILSFFTLLLVGELLPVIRTRPFFMRLYVHLTNGLYVDMIFTRVIRKIFSYREEVAAGTSSVVPSEVRS